MTISEDEIMAYVDGELDAAAAARVAAAIRADPVARARVEQHRRLREAARSAFADVLAETPPQALIDTATGRRGSAAAVVDLAAERARREARRPSPPAAPWLRRAGALAATLIIGLIVGRMVLTGRSAGGADSGLLRADPALTAALDSADPRTPTGLVKVGFSFRNHAGEYCRTFRAGSASVVAGIACRDARRWTVRVAAAVSPAEASGAYRTAASETPPAVLAAVDDMIQGPALDAQGEAEARLNGWRPRR